MHSKRSGAAFQKIWNDELRDDIFSRTSSGNTEKQPSNFG